MSIDDLSLVQPAIQFLIADAAHVATTVTLGPYGSGTNLVFKIHSSFTGQDYLSTGNNAIVTQDGSDRWAIAWEDWTDFNFSDVTMLICFQGPTAGCPLPADRTFGTGAYGNGSIPQAFQAEPVNTASGNYISQGTDAHLPGWGLPFDFSRSYNSLSTEVGVLGKGWTFNFASRIVANADGSATFVAEDGARVTYAADGAGGYVRSPGAYGVLTPAGGGGYDLLKKDQVRLHFDAGGLLITLTDRNANSITLTYTTGRISSITDTVGRSIGLAYDVNGRLATLTFPPARSASYTYTPGGLLETVTDARGGITTYGYDAADRLATIVDANDHAVVTNIYGPDGRVSEQMDARGFHTTYSWNSTTETATMTDARQGQWTDDYDAGILMSRTDPLGNTTTYAFDGRLGLSASVDPRGLKTETTVDGFGNFILVRDPAPSNFTEAWTYNARNDLLTHRDRRGNTTTYTYDTAGNLKTVIGPPPVSPLTTFNYDPSGNGLLISVVDPRGKTTSFGYDAQANRNRITTPLGNITTMTHDPGGRGLTIVEPRGNVVGADPTQYTTTFTYDAADHVRTTTTPLGHVTTIDYDLAGNRTAVTDANNHPTSFEYDAANHLSAVTDPLTRRTTYAYDEVGNLISRTDANLHVTTYAYDLAHRVTSETRPLNRVWSYEYDADGNVTKVIDPIAAATPTTQDFQISNTYNELNRLATSEHYGVQVVAYGYDANGNRTSVNDAPGASSYVYDELNRLTIYHRATGGHQIDYGYDAAGNVTSRTFADSSVETLTYDDDGRLATVTNAGATTTYGYDAAGNLLSTTLPATNGYVESRTYDRSGRLTEVKNQKGAAVLSRAAYTLDPVGNRLAMQSTTETATYTYDALNQLTQVCYTVQCTGPGDNFRQYTYDPVGNRLTEVRDTGTTTYSYDAADQLTGTTGPGGAIGYTYDLDGRTLTAGTRTFTWAQPDRLASTTQAGTTTTFTYDGDGLRLQASSGTQASKKTNFEWDVSGGLPELAFERDGNGALVRRYVNGAQTISVTAGNKTGYFHYDGLGSVVNLTSSTGASWWTYGYLPYGGVRTEIKNNNSAPSNLLRFAGEYLDPTALYYLRAREYDSGTGRFLSTDPARASADQRYITAYVYANANPVRFTDPSGRDTNGVCVNAEGFWGLLFGEAALCVIVSDTGQGGVILSGGTGGGAGLGAASGVSFLHADAAEIYDLENLFVVTGGSGVVGVGLQGEGFVGAGHCGQIVTGGSGGVAIGAKGSFKVGFTDTIVLFGLGPPKSECAATDRTSDSSGK